LKAKGVVLAKIDATVEENLAKEFGIRGFPSLKLFKNGKFHQDYNGGRTLNDIISFMEKKSGNPYTVVSSNDQVEKILAGEKYGVVVGYFEDTTSEAFLEFQSVADSEMGVNFLVFSESAAAAGCLNAEYPSGTVAVVGKDGSRHIFKGDIDTGLVSFFYSQVFPQSSNLDPEVFSKILAVFKVVVTAFDFSAANAAEVRKFATEAVAAQPTLKQFFADSKMWTEALVRMGVISGKVFPTAVVFSQTEQPISWDEEVAFDATSFSAWLNDVVAGTAKQWKKSEPVPESNDGPVKVVVAKNFDEIVLDKSKNVLLEFYAPWCGHCKNLEPTYKSLGEHFANHANVVIAKMDGTANYVDEAYKIEGFPTIKFFPAGDKSDVLAYEGTRTLDDLIEFVESNSN
jgi:protein disulfide isomerase